jgi:hypothetical protein
MTKKQFYLLIFLNLFYAFGFAQTPNPAFRKTVDSINAIIKANPLAYFSGKNQGFGHFTKISATQQGIISFTDSIPKTENKPIEISEKKGHTKPVLVSDCCPPKKTRTLDLFAINNWDMRYFYAELKDKNNEKFAQFVGFKRPSMDLLKEQLDKLTTLCRKEETTK